MKFDAVIGTRSRKISSLNVPMEVVQVAIGFGMVAAAVWRGR